MDSLQDEDNNQKISGRLKRFLIVLPIVILLNIFFIPSFINRNKVDVTRKDILKMIESEEVDFVKFTSSDLTLKLVGEKEEYISKPIEDEKEISRAIKIMDEKDIDFFKEIPREEDFLKEISKYWLIPILFLMYILWLIGI